MSGILSDFIKKTQQKYKKTNDQIVFDSNTVHDVCSSGSMVIDSQFDGGLAIYGRLIELLSFECLTGDQVVTIRINKDKPNNSKVISSNGILCIDVCSIPELTTDITMLDLMSLVDNSKNQIEIDTPDGWQEVGDFFYKGQKKILEITTISGKKIKCSKNHLIETKNTLKRGYDNVPNGVLDNNNFCMAKWLEKGDEMISSDGVDVISSIEYIGYDHVYDIEVKHPNHRYYANGVSHHNSGGKTTLAMQSMREAKKKGIVLLFDNEQAFDYTYANSMGLFEDDNFVVFRPQNAEETEAIAEDAVATFGSSISMMVFDSVAATRPKSEMDRKHGDSSQKAEHATFWGSFGNKLVMWASRHHIAVILINQLRSKPSIGNMDKFSIGNTGIGAGYSNTDTSFNSTGGFALKFQLSARYLLRMTSTLKEQIEDDVTGEIEELRVANVFRIESIKNKCFAPFKRSKYVIRFGVGTDDTSIIKDYLTAVGVISTTGSFISYKSDNPELCFRLNGKSAFNKRFSDPDIIEDAKKQFLHFKQSGQEIQVQSNSDIWNEGVNAEEDDGMVEELQV